MFNYGVRKKVVVIEFGLLLSWWIYVSDNVYFVIWVFVIFEELYNKVILMLDLFLENMNFEFSVVELILWIIMRLGFFFRFFVMSLLYNILFVWSL